MYPPPMPTNPGMMPTNPGMMPQPLPAATPSTATPLAPPMTPPTSCFAGVCVEKHGPESAQLNQPLSYEIIVRNLSQGPVQQVTVEDELPAGAKFLGAEPSPVVGADRMTWTLNTLEPGAERHLQVHIQPTAAAELHTTATVRYAHTAVMHTRIIGSSRLVMTMRGPEQVNAGDSVPFSMMLTNAGTAPITKLLLHCNLPDGLTHPQGQVVEADVNILAPGETRNITLTTRAAKAGQYTTEVCATADGGLEIKASAAVQVRGSPLQLTRSGPAKCYIKNEVGFELEVVNGGAVPAAYVEVGDTLPAGLDFVSATDGGHYDSVSRTILWRLPGMQAGAHQKVAYRVKAVGVGEMPDRAAARTDTASDVKADATFTVEGIPAMSLEVVDLEDPIEVGSDLTYEIRVVNQGSCPCTNIVIGAVVPDGCAPREGSGPSAVKINAQEVSFEPLPKLAVKADAVYRVKVRGLQPGDYRFRVQMTCDQLRQPVSKEEASRVYKDGP
jgi:uncharacterized repeat protein (TIGR01451 family)